MGLADVGGGCCERICERIAAQLLRWGETRRDGWAGRFFVTCVFEIRGATGDGDRWIWVLASVTNASGGVRKGICRDSVLGFRALGRWYDSRNRSVCHAAA